MLYKASTSAISIDTCTAPSIPVLLYMFCRRDIHALIGAWFSPNVRDIPMQRLQQHVVQRERVERLRSAV